MNDRPTLKALMATALLERDVSADAAHFNLHDFTQIAALMRPERTMTITGATLLSPIERASIVTGSPATICFHN